MPVMIACNSFGDAVERLKARGEYRFPRYELPDGHPAQREGKLHDYLVLGADDVLRPQNG
jgi:hypothetical protein